MVSVKRSRKGAPGGQEPGVERNSAARQARTPSTIDASRGIANCKLVEVPANEIP